ncbi:hypothetical protein F511_07516 [Dorcoceras hygrometricum]|uniref:Uncharacterized protein n=1 Tax=Dorcoceras hygrometricum TaxID=472368 RepID=A0A2Z7BAL3_9LAMI|nr:hypothetical protein F511_07516 [Dorcoceras hygrometricum]
MFDWYSQTKICTCLVREELTANILKLRGGGRRENTITSLRKTHDRRKLKGKRRLKLGKKRSLIG